MNRYESTKVDGEWGIRDRKTGRFERVACACGFVGDKAAFDAYHRPSPFCSRKENALRQTARDLAGIANLPDPGQLAGERGSNA
jgi:hypothetical protein